MTPEVRDVLRVGAFDLLVAGTGAHAAVDSAVEAVRRAAGGRPTGFVNAVLRRLARDGEPAPPEGAAGTALGLGVAEWMWERLAAAFGADDAAAFLAASNREAPVGVWARRPLPAGWEATPVEGIPDAWYLDSGDGLAPAAARGDVVVTDPASRAVALAVAASPGEKVADLAAAPGGKTAQLWAAMEGRGELVAVDANPRRLADARRRLAGLGMEPAWVEGDARTPPSQAAGADAVLLDAPCTGLGTLRRRPEIRHRLEPGDPAAMGAQQRQMLEGALGVVRPGGRVVYSVCTVFPEETIDVVAGLPAAAPPGLPGRPWGNGLLLAPHITGTDGMFISRIG
jgi:16S rRNA (cytosine967-C5)-methyltransferase